MEALVRQIRVGGFAACIGTAAIRDRIIYDFVEPGPELAGLEQRLRPGASGHGSSCWKPCFKPVLYRARNRIERFFNRIKHFRRSPRATKSTPRTSWPCSSWLRHTYGCAIMSLCPSHLELKFITL
jgi:hypothetical protein